MTTTKNNTEILIYTRFSSDLQSAKSCDDQEREVRAALERMGIDHSKAIVIHDEAEQNNETGVSSVRNYVHLQYPAGGLDKDISTDRDQNLLTTSSQEANDLCASGQLMDCGPLEGVIPHSNKREVSSY